MPQALIPFLGATYNGRSLNVDASRCVNFYPELTGTQDNKAQMCLVGTPGLSIFTIGVGGNYTVVRGMTTFNGVVYAVIGSDLYSIASDGTGTKRTAPSYNLSTSTGRVSFANNGVAALGVGNNELMIVDGADGYIYDVTSHAFSKLAGSGDGWADVLTAGGPTQVEFIDGYFVVTTDTLSYWVSDLYDGYTWHALATAAVAATPDPIQAVINHRQQLFFIKQWSTEVWADAGTPTTLGSPFQRVSGAVYDYGTTSPWSLAKGGNSFYFLSTQRVQDGGELVGVAEVTDYTPVIISPPAINHRITSSSTNANTFGYCYADKGHIFYVLTNPDDNWTLVYDATTKMWHERGSFMSDTTTVPRHVSNCYTYCYGKHLVGAFNTAIIYEMSEAYNSDAGNPIFSFRTTQTIQDPSIRANVFINQLTVDMETGVGGTGVAAAVTPFKGGWSGSASSTNKGAYNAGTAYSVDDVVSYSGTYYICIQAGTGHQPDISGTYWSSSLPLVLILGDGSITGGALLLSEVNPQVNLAWSNDAGHTWSSDYSKSLGATGAYSTRVIWRRLGKARDRVFKLSTSALAKKVIINAFVEAGK